MKLNQLSLGLSHQLCNLFGRLPCPRSWATLVVLTLGLCASGAALNPPPQLQLRGLPNETYLVEASGDLRNWTVISTNQTDVGGRLNFTDTSAANFGQRFYRGRLPGISAAGFQSDRILVKPKLGVDLSALNLSLGVTVLNTFPAIGNLQIVRVPGNLLADALITLYLQSGLVQYAERDFRVQSLNDPNDFFYQQGNLWNLKNSGQQGGTPGADISASLAWDTITSANSVIVAVIDTGVRYTHEDLAPNMWTNPGEIAGNGIDDDGDGYVDDVHGINTLNNSGDPNDDFGHGSHVSGTLGAAGNNSAGIVGVCWGVQIMALKFLDSQGNGSIADAIKCIDYARAKGAKVINASWGAPSFTSQALHDAIASARDADIIFAAAAGNSAGDNDVNPLYPASYELDNIISVAATTRNDALASFSNFGATNVDLAAPGSPIYSCWNSSDSSYQYFDGSSMAAAHLSGACALLRARYPSDTYRQIINRIYAGVDPLPGLVGKCATGGRLNVFKALGATPPPLPTVTVTATDMNAAESGDTGSFTVSRTGSTAAALVVNYSMSGTASNGTDYQTLSGAVTVAAGSSSATVTVTPVDDTAVEGSETAVLTIAASSAYTVGSPNTATVTIADNDQTTILPTVAVTATDASASEPGNTGTFTVSRTGDTTSVLTVIYSMSGTTQNGIDYQTLSGSVAIAAGASAANITVTPIDDTTAESNETAILTITANSAYTVGSPNSATVTIADDDQPATLPTVAVTATDQNATENGDPGAFTVTRTGSTSAALSVNYTMNGTAQNGTDYQTLSGTVTITAGSSSASITLTPIDDTTVEGNETAVLTLTASSVYTIGSPNSATVTIADNDQPTLPAVTITATDTGASEAGDTGTFAVSRTGSTTAPLTVNYTTSGIAQNGTDYQSLPGSVTIAAGSSSASITLTPIDDTTVEGNETAALTLTANSAYTVGSPNSATVTIADNDQPTLPTVTITATDASASESDDTGTFAVSRTGSTTAPLTVNYTTSGTAQNGADYQSLPGSVTIPTGSTSANISLIPINDTTVESSETAVLTLSANSAYTVGSPNSATVTIADDDQPPVLPTVTITASDANAAEPGDPGAYTITRTGSTGAALMVNYAVSGTAQNGADYQTLSGTVSIPAGSSSANVSLTPIDDTTVEGSETTTLKLSTSSAYTIGSPSSATITIADNDQPPALVADFTASRLLGVVPLIVDFTDRSTGNPVSWNWNFGDGSTATAQNPTHIFLIPGNYTVTLTVRNSMGNSSSKSTVIRVTLLPLLQTSSTETPPAAADITDNNPLP